MISERKKKQLPCEQELQNALLLREQLKASEPGAQYLLRCIGDARSESSRLEQQRDGQLKLLGNTVDPSVPFSNSEDQQEARRRLHGVDGARW